jgi:hypothetical protein
METEYKQLLITVERFLPYIQNTQLKYLFIAPSDKKAFNTFIHIVGSQPNLTNSYYETLTNNELVFELLTKHFSPDIELDIYITSIEPIMITSKLRDYIKKNGVDFEY